MENDYTKLDSLQFLETVGTDAHKWANAFKKMIIERGIKIDEELMVTWFSNAMMATYDDTVNRYSDN